MALETIVLLCKFLARAEVLEILDLQHSLFSQEHLDKIIQKVQSSTPLLHTVRLSYQDYDQRKHILSQFQIGQDILSEEPTSFLSDEQPDINFKDSSEV